MAQGRERKRICPSKLAPGSTFTAALQRAWQILKAQTVKQNKWKDLLLSEKHKGLACKYFIPGPPLPLCLCSSQHACEGQENTLQLWRPAPRTGCWGSKASWGAGGVREFPKRLWDSFAPLLSRPACVARALPPEHSGASVSDLPKSLPGAWRAAVQNLPCRGGCSLAAPIAKPPNISVHWRANPRSLSCLEQTWGQMSQIKRKMPVFDKSDSWKWCFQDSFIVGAGKMK